MPTGLSRRKHSPFGTTTTALHTTARCNISSWPQYNLPQNMAVRRLRNHILRNPFWTWGLFIRCQISLGLVILPQIYRVIWRSRNMIVCTCGTLRNTAHRLVSRYRCIAEEGKCSVPRRPCSMKNSIPNITRISIAAVDPTSSHHSTVIEDKRPSGVVIFLCRVYKSETYQNKTP